MRILLIEDDSAAAQTTELWLKSAGIKPFTTDLGEEGVDLAKRYAYDLILLDSDLPDMPGEAVVRAMRAAGVRSPIIFLSARDRLEIQLRVLDAGADDYMPKPLHRDLLITRMRAVFRRSINQTTDEIVVGPLTLSTAMKTARVGGRAVHLTGKEYAVLEALACRLGHTLTKEALMDQLYNGMDEPELKIVDVFVCKIRKKLAAAGGEGLIETVWGRGYVLRAPQETAVAA